MKLITDQKELTQQFISLAKKYNYISFASAWASSQHEAFEELLKQQDKIKYSTIGLHFYQTDPAVLREFKDSEEVKFILHTDGVFHPKIYLFWNDCNDWALLSGSANFTTGAFSSKNTENMLLITSNDNSQLFIEVSNFLEKDCYDSQMTKEITDEYIERYSNAYKTRAKDLSALSNIYSNKEMAVSLLDVDILNYSWKDYFTRIQMDKYHGLSRRLDVLSCIEEHFNNSTFYSMDIEARRYIAGLNRNDESGWFGRMVGNGIFHQQINNNNKLISDALDIIPLTGNVSKQDFMEYVKILQSIPEFATKKNSLGSFSRLITMKRPDLFFCINQENEKQITTEFGIKKSNMTLERYWDEILQRIYDTPWFRSEQPTSVNKEELLAWKYRVALIDCIYYKINN